MKMELGVIVAGYFNCTKGWWVKRGLYGKYEMGSYLNYARG